METIAGSAGIPLETPSTIWPAGPGVAATVTGVNVTRAPARGSPVPARVTTPSIDPPAVPNCLADCADGRAKSVRTATSNILMKQTSGRRSTDSSVEN